MLNDDPTLRQLLTSEGQSVFFRFSDVEAWVTEMPASYLDPSDKNTVDAVLRGGAVYRFGGVTASWLLEELRREAKSLPIVISVDPQNAPTESGEDKSDANEYDLR